MTTIFHFVGYPSLVLVVSSRVDVQCCGSVVDCCMESRMADAWPSGFEFMSLMQGHRLEGTGCDVMQSVPVVGVKSKKEPSLVEWLGWR